MYCPYCKSKNTRVVDKRDNDVTNSIRRRRECEDCNKRFTTYERIEKVLLNICKRNGKTEEFNREKLKLGILKAVKKRNIPEEKLDELIDEIEQELMGMDTDAVKSVTIGNLVLKKLNAIDKLGALLFAAVYKEFDSLEEVEAELKRLSD
ncbi:MAG: transcriptional regulator NrdR [Candidatus Dojkabacteria bacterium]|nr:transcriptional regulator NrdR [Candidatus Dojkabacteria bacterium]MDQ7021458.1 transcriptional regulator NrdR [Candidatus Dojkabacteria bacterium]